MTTSQKRAINKVNENLERGDLKIIAEKTGKRPEYVSRVLNPFNPAYDEAVVAEAVLFVAQREQDRNKILEKLPA